MLWLILLPILGIGAVFTYLNLKHYVDKHDFLNKRSWTRTAPIWLVAVLFLFTLIPYGHVPALLSWVSYLTFIGYFVFGISFIQHAIRWGRAIAASEHTTK